MKEELAKLDKEIAVLKESIRTEVANAEVRVPREQHIEAVAAVGLFNLALDQFSVTRSPVQPTALSTSVGNGYTVTDQVSFALAAAPQGQTYRCIPIVLEGPAASIKCEPLVAKP